MAPIISFLTSSGSRKKEPRCVCLSDAKASHSHKMWTEISSSVPHFLQMGLLLSPITYKCLLKVLRPARRPVTTLDCVLLKDNNWALSQVRPINQLSHNTENAFHCIKYDAQWKIVSSTAACNSQGTRIIHSFIHSSSGEYYMSHSSSLLSKNLKIKIFRIIILLVVLYGCETWSLILREEQMLSASENRVLRRIFSPKRDEVTGE